MGPSFAFVQFPELLEVQNMQDTSKDYLRLTARAPAKWWLRKYVPLLEGLFSGAFCC